MQRPDCEQLTLSQADFHVNHFPWLESKKVKGTNATYGRKCSELSESLRRVGYLVRTYLESSNLPGEQYARTWSVRDTLSPYLILKLRLSERHTDGKESHLWQTPSVEDAGRKGSAEAWMQYQNDGRTTQCRLRNQVQMWPTPSTGAGLCGGTGNFKQLHNLKDQGVISEEERRNMSQGSGGQLNPEFVEYLMNFPRGWTQLD